MPSILAGIQTAAVIAVGTATLGALIGAGGYGQPILTGIRLDDTALILEGAVPAALLALAVQGLFDLVERARRLTRPAPAARRRRRQLRRRTAATRPSAARRHKSSRAEHALAAQPEPAAGGAEMRVRAEEPGQRRRHQPRRAPRR